jgi:hypothetical protein
VVVVRVMGMRMAKMPPSMDYERRRVVIAIVIINLVVRIEGCLE